MRAELFHDEAGFTPRPAWQVIEAARQRCLTGELSLATAPATNVYLRDGQVYFAERSTDSGLGVRLLVNGVITRQQLGKGAVLASGVEHLGRLFDRDPSIDRHVVELCVETMTDDTLVSAADEMIADYRLTLYRRHPSGIDRWVPNRVEIVTHVVE
ncbi:MAG: DNA gyrase modulator, partial [Actinomycetota bacterium]